MMFLVKCDIDQMKGLIKKGNQYTLLIIPYNRIFLKLLFWSDKHWYFK